MMSAIWRNGPIAVVLAGGLLLGTTAALAQNCTPETPCPDRNKHTTAKIVGGSAAGGAVVGGVAGGPVGAVVGGAVGAGGGVVADKIRKHHNRRKYGTANPNKRAYRRHHRRRSTTYR